ncbi:MAG TPA: hypothetical protein VHZ56_11635 [Devosia sp.]|nr:hypothetical protein [Devosia sp.]
MDCLNWMLTDPAKHQQFCEPGHDYIIPWPEGNGGQSGAPSCGTDSTAYITESAYLLAHDRNNCCHSAPSAAAYVLTGDRNCCVPSVSYQPSLDGTPGIVLAHDRCGGCTQDDSYAVPLDGTPSIILAGNRGDCGGCQQTESFDMGSPAASGIILAGNRGDCGGCSQDGSFEMGTSAVPGIILAGDRGDCGGCQPNAYHVPSASGPDLLLTGNRGDCGGCNNVPSAFHMAPDGAPALLLAGNRDCGGCDQGAAFRVPLDGAPAILLAGDCGGGCPLAFRTPADGGPSLLLAGNRGDCGGCNPYGRLSYRPGVDGPSLLPVTCGGGCQQTPEAFRPTEGSLPWVLPVDNDCNINGDVRLPVISAPQLWI